MPKKIIVLIFVAVFCPGFFSSLSWLVQATGENASGHTILVLQRACVGADIFVDVEGLGGQDDVVDAHSDINALDNAGFTKLHRAVRGNNLFLVKLLMQSGARVDVAQDLERQTPLHLAILLDVPELDRVDFLALLLMGNGANIDQQDVYGNTILHYAAWYHAYELCKWLLEHGADGQICDAFGNTPFALYVQTNRFSLRIRSLRFLTSEVAKMVRLFLGPEVSDPMYRAKIRGILGRNWFPVRKKSFLE
ncbi:ankyrin repeat domain-containing protein [Candidatus Babeliales bacterium]|nr:ankyrin repeat domain-containing protein [Candidatus Babeliales bacterium]